MPPRSLPSPPAHKHAIAGLVAASLLTIAVAGGGYRNEVGAAAGLLAWWTVAALGLAGALVQPSRAARVCGLLLVGFAAFTVLSLAWGDDAGRGSADAARVIAYLGLFVLVVTTMRPRSEESWLTGLTAGCAAVALLALAVRLMPFLDPTSAEEIALADGRLGFPIGYWNALAAMAAIALAGAVWLGTEAKNATVRALGAAVIPALGMVILLTASAGGALAATVGVIVLLLKSPARRSSIATLLAGAVPGLAVCAVALLACDRVLEGASGFSGQHALMIGALGGATLIAWVLAKRADDWMPDVRPRGPAAIGLLAGAGVLAAGAVVLVGLTSGAPSESGPFPTGSGSGRTQFWEAGFDAFASAPLAGIGAGGYEAWWTQFGGLAFNTKNAHSLPIETLAELGLVGLALLAAFLTFPLVRGAVSREPAAAGLLAVMASGLVSATVDWMWEIPAAFAPVIIAAGALTAGSGIAAGAAAPAASRASLGPRLGLALLCVIGILSCGLTAASNWALTESRVALGDGDLQTAIARADLAVDLHPWDAEARLQKGLLAERAGELRAAADHLREAASRAPDDWRIWVALSRVALKGGNVTLAFKALTKARELNPRNPVLFSGA